MKEPKLHTRSGVILTEEQYDALSPAARDFVKSELWRVPKLAESDIETFPKVWRPGVRRAIELGS